MLFLGNYGNELDAKPPMTLFGDDDDEKNETTSDKAPLLKKKKDDHPPLVQHSMTKAEKPMSFDKHYFHMPYGADKQCTYVTCYYEDLRKRVYHEIGLCALSDHLVSCMLVSHNNNNNNN